jgi:hypothetical protein
VSELAEFGDLSEMEALLRASILFKFEGGPEAKMFGSSPIYNSALIRLRDAILDASHQSKSQRSIQNLMDWYRLSSHPHRQSVIVDYAATKPDWRKLPLRRGIGG